MRLTKNKCHCGNIKSLNAIGCMECFQRKRGARADKTKGEYKGIMSNWWEARVPIAKNARIVFRKSNKEKKCLKCGYDKHYEVCHIKAVSDFTDTSTLEEINSLDNLIALCRNCHWEYDHGLLKL